MAQYVSQETIENALSKAIQTDVEAAMEKAIEEAKQKMEENLRKEIANIALRLCKMYSVEMRSDEIIITIKDLRHDAV